MGLVDQLWELYEREDWHNERLTRKEADEYHQNLLDMGRIITVQDGNRLVAYVEFSWEHGICEINNLFIRPEYRGGRIIRMMKKRLEALTNFKVVMGDRNKFGKRFNEFQLRSK